ncbi:hypothetical protein ACTNEU_10450 [Ellagibacter isourolithinifaciens]
MTRTARTLLSRILTDLLMVDGSRDAALLVLDVHAAARGWV